MIKNKYPKKFDWVHEIKKNSKDLGKINTIESYLINILLPNSKKNVLDIGCGYGRLGLRMALAGCAVRGVDSNQSSVEKFNLYAQEKKLNAKAICRNVSADIFNEQLWDVILAVSIMHGIPSARGIELMEHWTRATQAGGYNLVTLFTNQGEAFSKKDITQWFFPKPKHLYEFYKDLGWDVLYYIEKPIQTMVTGASQLVSSILTIKR